MPKTTLHARGIPKLTALNGKQTDYFDHDIAGLALRVTPKGLRSWCLMYRVGRKLRRYTLGRYPTITLDRARALARKAMFDVHQGIDPAAKKQLDRSAMTFEELANEFIEKYSKPRKRSWKEDKRMVDNHLIPEFRHFRAKDITRGSVRAYVEKKALTAPIHANALLICMNTIFNWATGQEIVESNPCTLIPKPGVVKKRDRVLTEEEIRKVWQAIEQDDSVLADTFKLRLITLQRSGEIATMRWKDLDLQTRWWTIPAERSKNGLAHRVWLSDAALRIIEKYKKKPKGGQYVFAGKQPGTPAIHWNKALERIKDASGVEKFTAHDLRRTGASHMTAMGIPRLVVHKILNHSDRDITAVYDRHSYDVEKMDALDRWSKRLLLCVSTLRGVAAVTD
jgi:integrase